MKRVNRRHTLHIDRIDSIGKFIGGTGRGYVTVILRYHVFSGKVPWQPDVLWPIHVHCKVRLTIWRVMVRVRVMWVTIWYLTMNYYFLGEIELRILRRQYSVR